MNFVRGKLAVGLVCIGLTGACGSSSDDGGSIETMSDPDVVASVNDKLGPVKGAFDHPSGTVDASTMPRLVDSMQRSSSAGSANPFAGSNGSTSSSMSRGLSPQTNDMSACMTQSGNTVTVDMGCFDPGMTGTMVMRAVYPQCAEAETYVAIVKAHQVCAKPDDGGYCMNGDIYVEASGSGSAMSMTMLQDLQITVGNETHDLRSALRMRTGEEEAFKMEMVLFDGDDSYVVTLDSGGNFSVAGANGRFDCTYTDEGEHGSCVANGDATATWTW